MISKKLSLNKVCIILATTILLLSVVMFSVLYILTKEMSVVFCSMAFCLLFLLCVTVFVILIRRKLTLFSEILCCTLDEMMNGKIDIAISNSIWFFTYKFVIFPMFVIYPFLIALTVIIPAIIYRKIAKTSIIERLHQN